VYNVHNDAWGLISLGGVLVALSSAVPWPRDPFAVPSSKWGDSVSVTENDNTSGKAVTKSGRGKAEISKRVSTSIILITVFHHLTTAYGAYQNYKRETHYNTSMGIGVWVNAFLATVGIASTFWGDNGYGGSD